MLSSTDAALVDGHDLVMFDLDGVVYVSGHAIGDVADHIRTLRASGRHIAFVTNNASRTPDQVAKRLTDVGVAADVEDVVTSAQAAAGVVVERFGAGARVLMLGAAGLREALESAGLDPVETYDPQEPAVAVVSGYGGDVQWKQIMRAATLVQAGIPYIATNTDMTVPTTYGLAPGHGVFVNMLASFAGVTPTVAGKPRLPLMEETVKRVGGVSPLMVGDRLDTDIEGANALGVESLLVLTGVTWLPELVAAPVERRPSYISADTSGLFGAHPVPTVDIDAVTLGGWSARVVDGRLSVVGDGEVEDWWRVVAEAAWRHLDAAGVPVDITDVVPPGPDRVGGDE